MENKEITLEEAAEQLDQMTPEDLLSMLRYHAASETNLPEAPTSINFKATSKAGYDFMITLRDWDEDRLLDRVLKFAAKLDSTVGISPSNKSADSGAKPKTEEIRITSDVDASVIDGDDVIFYEVSSLQYKESKQGPYFKAKGGRWTQWGWNAFQNVFPEGVKLPVLAKDQETTEIPKELQYAYVDKSKKRVVAFATNS